MQEKPIFVTDIHSQFSRWEKDLQHCLEELSYFQHKLEELAVKNTGKEIKLEQEQFQNRFIRQNEVIDTLLHEVREQETLLAKFAKAHPVALEHIRFMDPTNLREKMNSFYTLYATLKDDFHRYLAKWI